MRLLRILRHRVKSLLRSGREESDLNRELALHLDQLVQAYTAQGMSAAEAFDAARRDFGSVGATKEECRDARGMNLVDEIGKDVGYAIRILRKSPAFTLTAIGSLALGIGANTAMFTMVHALLLQPLRFDRPDRLVALFERNVSANLQQSSVAPGNFLEWQAAATTFESMSGYTLQSMTVARANAGAEPQRIVACACSGNLFATLGVAPAAGRVFRAGEDRAGAPRAAVISYNLWRQELGGAPDAVGKPILLNDQDYEVVGIMPPSFVFPNRIVDVWVPLLATLPPPLHLRHDLHFLQVVGRVRPEVTIERATAEVDAIAARYKNAHPGESTGRGALAIPLRDALVGNVRGLLLVLVAAVACVLLIACVNLASLMLTRAATRMRELGIRTALGANRARLARQLLTESLVLGVAGGIVGAGVAIALTRLFIAEAPGANAILPAGTAPVDPAVFAFAFAITIVAGVAIGLAPAIRGSRADVAHQLKDGNRSTTAGRPQGRFRNVLVGFEVAMSVVLLASAGLLVHSFAQLYQIDPGMRLDHMVAMNVSLPATHYPDPAKRSATLAEVADRLRPLPGVKSVGLTSCTPLSGSCNILFFYIEGRPFVPGKFFSAFEQSVDPGFFAAAGIPLRQGRTFRRDDGVGFDPQHPRLGAVVISEAMARTFFPTESPIGKRIFFDYELQRERNQQIPTPRYEIVGVVGDVVPSLDAKIGPALYRPLLDVANNGASVVVHTAVDPQAVVSSVRNEIHQVDRGISIGRARTLDDLVSQSTSDRRFTMLLFAAFAALAVLLAAMGLYGVVSFAVSRRTAEIGVRMALGATTGDVGRLILLQGLKPAAIGIVCGLLAAAFATRLVKDLLFGVVPLDPLTFAVVPPALLGVAALACIVPAWRAMRLNPTTALRTE